MGLGSLIVNERAADLAAPCADGERLASRYAAGNHALRILRQHGVTHRRHEMQWTVHPR